MLIRVFLAILLLAAIHVAVSFINARFKPDEIRAPATSLAEIPTKLGRWTGRDEALDPRLTEAVGAVDVMNRVYLAPDNDRFEVQVAAFTGYESGLPHPPEVCYSAANWVIIERATLNVKTGPDTSKPAYLLVFDQEGKQTSLLFWFQLGDEHIADTYDLRRVRKSLFGQRSWPPLVKVMIQSSTGGKGQSRESLREFAELVMGCTEKIR